MQLKKILNEDADVFEFTAQGLVAKAEATDEAIEGLFSSVLTISRASNWLLGDALNLIEKRWGDVSSKYEEASAKTGLSIGALKNIAGVCLKVPLKERVDGLSFTHHLVASRFGLDSKKQTEMLNKAKIEGLSTRDFKKEVKGEVIEQNRATCEVNNDRPFGLVELEDESSPIDVKYPLMSDICRLSALFENRDLSKISTIERRAMIDDLIPLLRDIYTLLQLELKHTPTAVFDVPFVVVLEA